jgi:hypothetical protein
MEWRRKAAGQRLWLLLRVNGSTQCIPITESTLEHGSKYWNQTYHGILAQDSDHLIAAHMQPKTSLRDWSSQGCGPIAYQCHKITVGCLMACDSVDEKSVV